MDILSARKKAAERAKAKKTGEAPAAPESQAPAAGVEECTPPPAPAVPRAIASPEPSADGTPAGPEQAGTEAAEPAATSERPVDVLAFRLGNEEYAIPVDRVREVVRIWEITHVPNTPPDVIGVTSLRGAVLPVMDLCQRLGVPAGTRDEKSRVIVTNVNDEGTGVIVDRVTGVVRFLPAELRPVPDSLEQGAEFLRGIVRKGDRLTIVLDLDIVMGA